MQKEQFLNTKEDELLKFEREMTQKYDEKMQVKATVDFSIVYCIQKLIIQ